MIRRPPRSTQSRSSAASDVYKRQVHGTVTLECVVKTDGTIGDVRVVKSVDKEYGLDDQAVKAAKAWRFTPAKDGTESIPSVVTLAFPFVLDNYLDSENGR